MEGDSGRIGEQGQKNSVKFHFPTTRPSLRGKAKLKLGKRCKEGRTAERETGQELHRTRPTESSGTKSVHSAHGSPIRCLTDYTMFYLQSALGLPVQTQGRAKPRSVRVSR